MLLSGKLELELVLLIVFVGLLRLWVKCDELGIFEFIVFIFFDFVFDFVVFIVIVFFLFNFFDFFEIGLLLFGESVFKFLLVFL